MFKSFPARIYVAALILRLVPVLIARSLGIGLDDMFQYDMLARSLVSGNGFRWYAYADLNQLASYVDFDLDSVKEYDPTRGIPTSFRAPLYPSFLALAYFFSGTGFSRFFAARLAQAVFLGAPLAPLTYLLSRRMFPENERASRVSAWVVAVYPLLLVYPLGLGTENPFFLLLLVSFLSLLIAFDRPTAFNLLLAGFFLGLTTLTRSVVLLFVAAAFCILFVALRRRAFLALFAFLVVVTPWVVRNSILHGRFTGVESSMGYNLYLGYHPQGNGSFVFGPSLDLIPILDDSIRDQTGTREAVKFIQAQPERLLPLAINRLGFFFGLEKRVLMYFYSNDLMGYIPGALLVSIAVLLLIPFVVVSVSAALSLPMLRWSIPIALLTVLFAAYLIPHVLILSEDRFHLAIVPFLAVLAAEFWGDGVQKIISRWQETSTGKMMVGLSVLFVILLIVNWGFELSRDAEKISALLGPGGNQTYFPY